MSKLGYYVSGTVGKKAVEDENREVICTEFEYYLNKGDTEITSPVYIFTPYTARVFGWHLLKLGIIDGIKDKFHR